MRSMRLQQYRLRPKRLRISLPTTQRFSGRARHGRGRVLPARIMHALPTHPSLWFAVTYFMYVSYLLPITFPHVKQRTGIIILAS